MAQLTPGQILAVDPVTQVIRTTDAISGALSIGSSNTSNLSIIVGTASNAFIMNSNGNIGIGKAPIASYAIDVAGTINATSVLVNGQAIQASGGGGGSGSGLLTTDPSTVLSLSTVQTVVPGSGASNSEWGRSVAMTSDTLITGGPGVGSNAGSVSIYRRNGSNATAPWVTATTVPSSTGNASARYGATVAISTDGIVALVGAPGERCAYMYKRVSNASADAWARTTVASAIGSGSYGGLVSISALQTTGYYAAVADATAWTVYLYWIDAASGTITTRGSVVVGSTALTSLAISSDGLLVAAGSASGNAVYVLSRGATSGATATWTLLSTQTGAASGDLFGSAVALSGASGAYTLVIGAPLVSSSSGVASGAVYIYTGTGTASWSGSSYVPPEAGPDDQVGSAVSIGPMGQHVLVANAGQGIVHVYQLLSSTWTYVSRLRSADGTATNASQFGMALAQSSGASLIAVGAWRRNAVTGAVYLYASASTPFQFNPSNATTSITAGSNTVMTLMGSNVGINNSNPAYALDIAGSLNIGGSLLQNGAPYIGSQWTTATSNIFLMNSNVGIRTSNPLSALDVAGDMTLRGSLRDSNGNTVMIPGGLVQYTAFSPALTTTAGVAVAASNAVVSGRYMQVGTQVQASASVTIASMSNFPVNGWRLTLPAVPEASQTYVGTAEYYQASTSTTIQGNARVALVSGTWYVQAFNPGPGALAWGNGGATGAAPGGMTLAAGDIVTLRLTYEAAASPIALPTTGMNLYQASNGNIGVGTSAPAFPLDVNGQLRVGNRILGKQLDSNDLFWMGLTGTAPEANRVAIGIYGDVATGSISNVQLITNGTTRVYASSNGNVGISTSNPNYKLDVSGSIRCLTSSTTTGLIATSGDVSVVVGNVVGSTNAGSIQVKAGGTISTVGSTNYNLMLQSDGGAVGIGTTNNNAAQLLVYGSNQSTDGSLNTLSSIGGSIFLQDSGSSPYNGGALLFGANQGMYAGIKGYITDGSLNTIGCLSFHTRTFTSNSSLTEKMRITPAGSVGIGTTFAQTKLHLHGQFLAGNVPAAGVTTDGNYSGYFYRPSGGFGYFSAWGPSNEPVCLCFSQNPLGSGWSGVLSTLYVTRDTTTSRSINAAGTVNASGADYAEYMTKSSDFSAAKGDIIGIDSNGLLTNVYAEAIMFAVKSTNPCMVGGDVWGTNDVIGERPKAPAEDASQSDKDAYATTLADFEARLEAARQRVDRVAFCGQVPVNVVGAIVPKPGQYLVPVVAADGVGISAVAVAEDDLTLGQYRRAIGKVIKIGADGRPVVIVKMG